MARLENQRHAGANRRARPRADERRRALRQADRQSTQTAGITGRGDRRSPYLFLMKRTEPFDFYQPTTLAEASRLLKENGPGGRFLAGGTDLVIALKEKGLVSKYVVDLKKIPGFSAIREHADGSLTIGALTTMREVDISLVII